MQYLDPAQTGPVVTIGGRYALGAKLGDGGMGRVYEARHLDLGKLFALKVIDPARAFDHAARARFDQEALLASEISHPNIVSIVDFGQDATLGPYMVMDLVRGENLAELAIGGMPLSRACDLLGQIADALDHIHKRHIVHGDIKADNVMLVDEAAGSRRRKVARLLDFGLAHRLTARHVRDEVQGTPEYLAPECAVGESPSTASDVYALGILGYLMFARGFPFEGTPEDVLRAHVERVPPTLSARRGEPMDPALEALIARALAKDPADRHASAGAFRYELNTAMDMLNIGRRRSRVIRAEPAPDALIATMFEQSILAQAIVAPGGALTRTNPAFDQLLAELSSPGESGLGCFARLMPELGDALATATSERRAIECSTDLQLGAERRTCMLVCWLAPVTLPDGELHLMIRAEPPLARRAPSQPGT